MAAKQNKPISNKTKPTKSKTPLPATKGLVNDNKGSNAPAVQFMSPKMAMTILAVAAILAFIGAAGNDFLSWDDNFYIVSNPYIQVPSFANLLKLLKVECSLNYHPLTMVSLWLNSFLVGNAHSAANFIISNILIHALNTILVFIIGRKMANGNIYIAFFTALLWGVHPMHTESVAWISERKDLLYSFLFFMSMIQYINYQQQGKGKYWIFSLLFFLLSCLSKGMAVVLPLVLILLDYWFDKKPHSLKSLTNKIPFFILSVAFGLLAIHIQNGGKLGGYIEKLSTEGQSAIAIEVSLFQQICFGFYGFWVYIIKLFLPFNLHNYYPYPFPDKYHELQYTLAPVFAIALLIWAASRYKKNKIIFWGVLFFFFTISIVLQFISVGSCIVSERYTYIPYFGLLFMVVYWLYDKMDQKKLAVTLSIVSLVFIILSFRQARTFKDTITLFLNSYQYEKGPSVNSVIYEKICNYYGTEGDYKEAVRYAEEALSYNVESWKLYEILAHGYFFTKETSKFLQSWNKALAGCPAGEKKTLFLERGRMLRVIGNYVQSGADFDSALKYERQNNFSNKDSNVSISDLYYEKGLTGKLGGNYADALNNFKKAIQLNAAMTDTYLKEKALTECYMQDWKSAMTDYTSLIDKGISKDTAYGNRGVAKMQLGDKEGAVSDWLEALKINPNYSMARNNLNAALKK